MKLQGDPRYFVQRHCATVCPSEVCYLEWALSCIIIMYCTAVIAVTLQIESNDLHRFHQVALKAWFCNMCNPSWSHIFTWNLWYICIWVHCKTCSWNLTSLQNTQTLGPRGSQTCFHWISPPMLMWGFLKHWKRESCRVMWIFTASRRGKAWQNIILASVRICKMYIKRTDSRSQQTTNYAIRAPPFDTIFHSWTCILGKSEMVRWTAMKTSASELAWQWKIPDFDKVWKKIEGLAAPKNETKSFQRQNRNAFTVVVTDRNNETTKCAFLEKLPSRPGFWAIAPRFKRIEATTRNSWPRRRRSKTPGKTHQLLSNWHVVKPFKVTKQYKTPSWKHHLDFFGRAQRAAADKMAMKLLLLETKAWHEFVFGQVASQAETNQKENVMLSNGLESRSTIHVVLCPELTISHNNKLWKSVIWFDLLRDRFQGPFC